MYFQVLKVWHNKCALTVKDFIRHITRWQTSEYVSTGVWETLREHVSPDLLPAEAPPLAPSVNSGGTAHCSPRETRKLNKEGNLFQMQFCYIEVETNSNQLEKLDQIKTSLIFQN